MRKLSIILSTGLGIGYIPFAPGTFGTLWGVVIYYFFHSIPPIPPVYWLIGLFLLILVAIYLCGIAERGLQEHDSSHIVLDEVVGYLVAVFAIPFNYQNMILSFVLFRIFDILKPFPIRRVDQKLPGGWGVVLDDVVAGIFANAVLQLYLYLGRCL